MVQKVCMEIAFGVRELTHLVKCLLYKYEDLSLISSKHIKILSLVACICNPSFGEAETGRSLGLAGHSA